jgi:hypothetical protein
LLIWIAAYIESKTEPGDQGEDLGETLIGLVHFYGHEFRPYQTGIRVQGKSSFFELTSPVDYALTVDPVNPSNNTTKASFKVNEVLQHFAYLHAKLKEMNEKNRIRGFIKEAFNFV